MIQVVILAGGLGTRLRPITYHTPKALIPINDKPFLKYQLDYLKYFGLKYFLFLVSYLGRKIEAYFGDGSKFGLHIIYSYENTPMGTGGALKNDEDKIEENFLLLNGDTFFPIDYKKLIDYFFQSKKLSVIALYDNYEKIFNNNITLGESNLIVDYNKKSIIRKTHVDAGAYVFNKEIISLIPKGRVCSLEEEIFPKLIAQRQLVGYPTSQRFYDIGSFEQLKIAQTVLK